MAYLTDSLLLDATLTLVPVLYLVYWLVTYNDDYWDLRGVPNVKRGLLLRTMFGLKSQADQVKDIYNTFPDARYVGFFQAKKPILLIRDLDLINRVMVKDFVHFQDRGQPKLKNDLFSESLFSMTGQEWRALRYKLTPTFTTGKLKGMFEQVSKCGDNLMKSIEKMLKVNTELESKSFLFDYTLDVVSSCAFGVQFEPGSPHHQMIKSTIQNIFTLTPTLFLKFTTILLFPKFAEYFDIRTFPRDIADYFLNMTKATAKYRKDNNVQRNDYFQLLLNLKEQEESGKDLGVTMADATEDDDVINQMEYAGKKDQSSTRNQNNNVKLLTENSICGNSFIFLLAGSESTSSSIGSVLYELALHPDCQAALHQELDTVLAHHGGVWSYGALREMTYLDQVIQESQRIFPLFPMLMRECVERYQIPDSDVIIEKGVLIGIPIGGLQSDPRIYPDPERFDPERFKGNNFKPNPAFLPFGDGPRICIALRFAVMEMKSCLARMLSQYRVGLSPRTSVPLKIKVRAALPSPEGGIWLTFQKRSTASTEL